TGCRRIDDPADYVRMELEYALTRKTTLLPVLVGNAPMPTAIDLPEPIHQLAYLNATHVRADPDFHRDMERVIRAIGRPKQTEQTAMHASGPASHVTLVDASLDRNDSPYEEDVISDRKQIRFSGKRPKEPDS